MESKTMGGMFDEIMARLDAIEEKLDEILELRRAGSWDPTDVVEPFVGEVDRYDLGGAY